MQADRKSVYAQEGLSLIEALNQDWFNEKKALLEEGWSGVNSFKKGFVGQGDFDKLN